MDSVQTTEPSKAEPAPCTRGRRSRRGPPMPWDVGVATADVSRLPRPSGAPGGRDQCSVRAAGRVQRAGAGAGSVLRAESRLAGWQGGGPPSTGAEEGSGVGAVDRAHRASCRGPTAPGRTPPSQPSLAPPTRLLCGAQASTGFSHAVGLAGAPQGKVQAAFCGGRAQE